jgi:hypothetical protein
MSSAVTTEGQEASSHDGFVRGGVLCGVGAAALAVASISTIDGPYCAFKVFGPGTRPTSGQRPGSCSPRSRSGALHVQFHDVMREPTSSTVTALARQVTARSSPTNVA